MMVMCVALIVDGTNVYFISIHSLVRREEKSIRLRALVGHIRALEMNRNAPSPVYRHSMSSGWVGSKYRMYEGRAGC